MKKNAVILLLTGILTACGAGPITPAPQAVSPPLTLTASPVTTPQLGVPILDQAGNPTRLTADLYADHSVIHLAESAPATCYEWTADAFQLQDGTWTPMPGEWNRNNIYATNGNHRRIPAGLNQHVQFRGVPGGTRERPCTP